MFEDILGWKKAFPDYKNNKLKKWKICHFSRGVSPWLWLKIDNFSIFYWNIGKIAQQSVFESILERKKVFLDYKNNKLKKSKIWDFSKGVVTGFGQKLAIFPSF